MNAPRLVTTQIFKKNIFPEFIKMIGDHTVMKIENKQKMSPNVATSSDQKKEHNNSEYISRGCHKHWF